MSIGCSVLVKRLAGTDQAGTGQAGTGVMPEAEIRKPLPSAVQVTPALADSQRNGPTPVSVPYQSVGVPAPAFARHCCPVQIV